MYERYSHAGRPGHSIQRAFIYSNALAQVLVFISSGCNPIVYGIFNKNYRELLSSVVLSHKTDTDLYILLQNYIDVTVSVSMYTEQVLLEVHTADSDGQIQIMI